MNLFTHLMISDMLYDHLKARIPLNRSAFRFGNVKPDLSRQFLSVPHTLDNCIIIVKDLADNLVKGQADIYKTSIDLGVICHYICDFFCCVHQDNNVYYRYINHFFFEIGLQRHLGRLIKSGEITVLGSGEQPVRSVHEIIGQMKEQYLIKQETFSRDLTFAMATAVWASESIAHFMTETIHEKEFFEKYYQDFLAEPLIGM